MMPMIARSSSRWIRVPATCRANPSSHNTNRTTTMVQIKLTMKTSQMNSVLLDSASIILQEGAGGVNLARDPDPGLVKVLSSPARPDGRSRVGAETESGFESGVAACDPAALVAEDLP